MARGGGVKTEFELKLIGAPVDIAALAASPALARRALGAARTVRLVSTYFDTVDGALAAAGISLRLREGAGGRLQTLKREKGGGSVSRREEEIALGEGEAFPQPVGDRKAATILAAAGDLILVARIIADRTTLSVKKGRTRIEAAFDVGRLEAWGEEGLSRAGPLAEAEFELIDGEAGDLFDLVAATLEENGGRLRLGGLAKADQARRLAAADIPPEPVVELKKKNDADDALAAALRAGAARIVELIPAIGELRLAEGVHQMRIALRRFRSLEATCRKSLKGKRLRRLARRARDFAAALGPARDWDVFLAETLPPLEKIAGEGEAGLAVLKARAEALRAAAWDEAAHLVVSPAFNLFALDLMRAGHLEEWRGEARKSLRLPAREFAAAALDARLAEAREAARRIDDPDPAARHALRIALKKLRYNAQSFRTLFPGDARKDYMARLARLQDDLGAVNDAAVAQRLANEAAIGQGKRAARASGFVAGFHAAAGAARAKAVSEDWRAFALMAPFWEPEEPARDMEQSS